VMVRETRTMAQNHLIMVRETRTMAQPKHNEDF